MTRNEILALSGLALRAAVAERVMGWRQVTQVFGFIVGWTTNDPDELSQRAPLWEASIDACLAPDGPVVTWLATAPNNHWVITSRWVDCQDTLLRLHWIVGHNGTPAGIAEALCRAVLIATMEAR